jgi:hypothetical protein
VCLDNLDIKTEANSILGLFNICANTINIQQEAQSKVNLKNGFLQAEDSVIFSKGDVRLIGVDAYLIANNKIIIAENAVEIEKDGSTYIVF